MRTGVVFPQTEIGPDPAAVRDFAQAAEDLGYAHIACFDHVVGANPASRPGFDPLYTHQSLFHEPVVLFGYLAGLTRSLELVTFEGEWHTMTDAGIRPLPVQRPIPIWLGGMSDQVIRRVGQLADGWFPRFPSMNKRPGTAVPIRHEAPQDIVAAMRAHAVAAGRDPDAIGIEGRVFLPNRTPDQWMEEFARWQALGANYMQLYTMEGGLISPDRHIDLMRRFREVIDGG